jgi:hypothetical protein
MKSLIGSLWFILVAVPIGTVTQIITSIPSGVTLTVTNPTTGLPGATAQPLEDYQAQVIQAGSTGVFFVTTDITGAATINNNINITATALSNITFANGATKSGTIAAGGLQNIISSTIPTIFYSNGGNLDNIANWGDQTNGTLSSVLYTPTYIIEIRLPINPFTAKGLLTILADANIVKVLTNTIKNTCASCSISIVSIKNKDKKTSVIQSGGAIGDIPLIFTFTVTNSSPLTLVKETIQSAAQTSIQDPNQYCPAGELLDSTSVLCVSRVYVNMYTTNELNNTPDWVPPVAAIATAGVVGLALMGANKYLKSDTPVKPEAQAAGQIPTGSQHNTPILTEGEADLLNDLNLTPANMSEIFKADNEYAKKFNMTELKSWDTAISMFLGNLTTQSCYNNRLLRQSSV